MINLNLSGAELIAKERQRQIDKEGYTPEHDSHHIEGELAYAAICYANPRKKFIRKREGGALDAPVVTLDSGPDGPGEYYVLPETYWPFDIKDWKPVLGSRLREIAKAGAMLAAEGDRIRRMLLKQFGADAAKADAESLDPFDAVKASNGAVCVTRNRRIAVCDYVRSTHPARGAVSDKEISSLHLHVYGKTDDTFDEIEYDTAGRAVFGNVAKVDDSLDIIGILPVTF